MRMTTGVLRDVWNALGGPAALAEDIEITGEGQFASRYRVADLAGAAAASAALSIAELLAASKAPAASVRANRRLASFWFTSSLRPEGWQRLPQWDPIAGDYAARDGWIRLHTNAPHHRAAAQRVLGDAADKDAVARAVAQWDKADLESAIVEAGGCAAEMRSTEEWAAHPQGLAVAGEPLVRAEFRDAERPSAWVPRPDRPLAGLRVLDLTRVLAGPVASRFLAGYGAEVLRIDPPWWDEPAVIPEMTIGKRCARLDLRDAAGRAAFEALLARTDILLHGYRPGALEGLGYDAERLQVLSRGLIDVALCAYGWTGQWAGRRGFDSLVQMSAGIAHGGMVWRQASEPVPLPVQALDHATGYLMAAATLRAVTRRMIGGGATQARLSLARTAKFLTDLGEQPPGDAFPPETAADLSPEVEHTDWGPARRLKPPVTVAGAPMRWDLPAQKLGSAPPSWH